MPTAYVFARLRNSTDTMPSLTPLQRFEPTHGNARRKWVRLSDFLPRPPHRLVHIDVGLDAHWMLHHDTKMFWSREQAEGALRSSVETWVSWWGGAEDMARLMWVNEVHGRCTVLAKTTGEGEETRRWWTILEVHVPFAEGTFPPGP
jgi:hypothetical protein